MFSCKTCKTCKERELRLADLNKQIEFLKRLLLPNPQIPIINMEANTILGGAGTEMLEVPLTEEQIKQNAELEAEANRIMTGVY